MYEHNVIKNVNNHIKHIVIYDTEINYYNKKSPNQTKYYKLYHDNFHVGNDEIINNSQQTDIINNTSETNNQTTNYVDENNVNNNNSNCYS